MKIFAISDLHLSTTTDKPMDVFGAAWTDYMQKIEADWRAKVSEEDVVLIAGDISWAIELSDALCDVAVIANFPGKKVLIRGNHDYWWHSISRIRDALPQGVCALQNDAIRLGNVVITGSRGWSVEGTPEFSEEDARLCLREAERLRLCFRSANALKQEGDTLIAMMHFPPFNARREDSLFTAIFEENGVDKVVYGHLHGKDARADLEIKKKDITYYLTSCDLVKNTLIKIHETESV